MKQRMTVRGGIHTRKKGATLRQVGVWNTCTCKVPGMGEVHRAQKRVRNFNSSQPRLVRNISLAIQALRDFLLALGQ